MQSIDYTNRTVTIPGYVFQLRKQSSESFLVLEAQTHKELAIVTLQRHANGSLGAIPDRTLSTRTFKENAQAAVLVWIEECEKLGLSPWP
jgi:hypothetical protein